MTPTTALILGQPPRGASRCADGRSAVRFAGLDLVERATVTAQRIGIERIHIVEGGLVNYELVLRLRAKGLTVTAIRDDDCPFETAPAQGPIVVLPACTIVEPAALAAFLDRLTLDPGEAAVIVDDRRDAAHRFIHLSAGHVSSALTDGNAASTNIVVLTPEALERVRVARNLGAALRVLARAGVLHGATLAPRFCVRLHDVSEIERVEREYVSQTNWLECSCLT